MRVFLCIALGFSIGGLSGALGIGGGVLLVPALMWLFDWEYSKAAGTTLAVLVPPVGLLAAWKSYQDGRVDIEAALWIALAFVVGGYMGASVVKYIPADTLRLTFGLLMLYVSVRFIFGSHSEAANAAAGLVSVFGAWLCYFGLRILGRRHRARPLLGEHIRAREQQGRGENEYYI